MNRRRVIAIFLGAGALLGSRCGTAPAPLTGPSEEQGNPQIVAVVVDDARRPVPQATVSAYRVAANDDPASQPSAGILVAQSRADSAGACRFENLVPGVYSLKALDPDSLHATMRTNISVLNSKPPKPEYQDTLILTVPGGVHGVVTRGGFLGGNNNQSLKDAFIQIKIGEIDRSTVTGPDGAYSFLNLPAGTYTIYYYATDGFYSTRRENIIIRPAKDTALESVFLKPRILPPPKGFSALYDTAAGLIRFSWQKVVFEGFWYYSLERKCVSTPSFERRFTSFDTALVDSLGTIPSGTVLYYVICSVDSNFNQSANAGRIEITLTDKR
jgi:hypothetical protein